MTTIRKYCPYCKHEYANYPTYSGKVSLTGNPVKTCSKCGKHFFDKDVQEPAFSPPQREYVTTKECILVGFRFALFGLIVLVPYIFGAWKLEERDSWLVFIFGGLLPIAIWLAFVVSNFRNRKKEEEKRKKEYEESLERLRNLEYALLLKQVGYDVPSHFLVKKRDPKDYTKC